MQVILSHKISADPYPAHKSQCITMPSYCLNMQIILLIFKASNIYNHITTSCDVCVVLYAIYCLIQHTYKVNEIKFNIYV